MKKSLKDLYKEHRSQILTGIISSLLTAIIIGIYHWILVTAPTASAGIWGKIVNLYYTTAAQEQENSASVMLLSLLVGILFATGTAGSMPKINQTVVCNTPIVMTSFEKQEKVVANIESRLSICDSIEQTVDATLQQADALRQSILKQAFEGEL